jgi:alpha-L-fucosidase
MTIRSLLLAAVLVAPAAAQPPATAPKKATARPVSPQKELTSEERTRWWRDAKFGMFIHWGPYAVIGRHEWARHFLQIPQAEYDKFARAFHPVNFNPDQWVSLAQNAGAQYIVITSKHHDGFSIYRSKVSDYDMEITPYKGDPLRMLADACRRRGMRLGYYYSIMDWHHPAYVPKRAWEVPGQPVRKSDEDPGGNIDAYIEFMKAQIRELLTRYGPVATMWFDGEWEHTIEEMHSDEVFDMIRSLSPATLINDRIYKRKKGNRADHGTPEQFVPATGETGPDGKPILWESCVTINSSSWGYNKYETEFKTDRDLIRMLVEVVSKGGNLLLNVGPTPDGRIQDEFVTRLRAIGAWMRVNSESIYGATASPFARLPFFGRATAKGNTLYLHVFQWPKDGVLRVPGLRNEVVSAALLVAPAKKLATRRDGDDLLVTLPAAAPDEISSTVVLKLTAPPDVVASPTRPDSSGAFDLGVASAEIETRFEQRAKKENLLGHVYLTRWTRPDDVPVWRIAVPAQQRYRVEISYGAGNEVEGKQFEIQAGGKKLLVPVQRGPNSEVFRTFPAGELELPPGDHDVRVKPASGNLAGVSLEGLKLIPAR